MKDKEAVEVVALAILLKHFPPGDNTDLAAQFRREMTWPDHQRSDIVNQSIALARVAIAAMPSLSAAEAKGRAEAFEEAAKIAAQTPETLFALTGRDLANFIRGRSAAAKAIRALAAQEDKDGK